MPLPLRHVPVAWGHSGRDGPGGGWGSVHAPRHSVCGIAHGREDRIAGTAVVRFGMF